MRQGTAGSLAVRRGEVDVWLLPPPASPRDVPGHELDARERERAASYLRARDRQTYLAAHVGLRRVLAAYTGIAPGRIPVAGERYGVDGERQGRPKVLGVAGAPQFSLSHSHGLALVAVAAVRIGADVQRVPTAETVRACLPALHPAERRELLALPDPWRTAAFGRLWTRKEAYLKGLGTGLARAPGLDCLSATDLPARPPGWVVGNVPLCRGHVAAVALSGSGDQRVTLRSVPEEFLYARDAVERIARMEPGVRAVLRDRVAAAVGRSNP
ncbi:4'-phosphopantetheinyl transferase family protein [Streptomyces sp. NPDC091271]|uniref:4'-phosphopantetheinyl transferase family protein n=1 Tax=Streptomyces sp. NPDC091271 TaxID=3365980 RepID=UPI003814DEB0